MIIVFLGILAGIIVGWKMASEMWEEHGVVISIPLFAVAVLFGFLLGGVISLGIGHFPPQHFTANGCSLVALKQKDGIQGSFFLGSGSIQDVQYYFYYRNLGNNTYRMGKEKVDNCVVVEDGRKSKVWFTPEFNNRWWYLVGLPSAQKAIEFHVPKGSISKDFRGGA